MYIITQLEKRCFIKDSKWEFISIDYHKFNTRKDAIKRVYELARDWLELRNTSKSRRLKFFNTFNGRRNLESLYVVKSDNDDYMSYQIHEI